MKSSKYVSSNILRISFFSWESAGEEDASFSWSNKPNVYRTSPGIGEREEQSKKFDFKLTKQMYNLFQRYIPTRTPVEITIF